MINIHPHDKTVFMIGCMGGTIAGMLNIFYMHDLIYSVATSAIGASVSFLVSWILNRLFKKSKR
ncbi:hypothetical protein FRZ67_11720 [Panacibacter ginsenosidivorans]|uniref:Uncharacterized protein n=1 Tax=Panacibacter ginsenosidivorans TaxID=1813871 RepID=A0A5B8VB94_9BACT|nr:hypothetical protein [Panacibacter ginsenosidivorans]QEC67936.1 hypothetical protein FRZ67_11720 [Panacibacter ginsenosidivorans]